MMEEKTRYEAKINELHITIENNQNAYKLEIQNITSVSGKKIFFFLLFFN